MKTTLQMNHGDSTDHIHGEKIKISLMPNQTSGLAGLAYTPQSAYSHNKKLYWFFQFRYDVNAVCYSCRSINQSCNWFNIGWIDNILLFVPISCHFKGLVTHSLLSRYKWCLRWYMSDVQISIILFPTIWLQGLFFVHRIFLNSSHIYSKVKDLILL